MTDETAMDLDYWANHLRQPVRFSSAVEHALDIHDSALFVEVGPRNTLTSLTSQMLTDPKKQSALASLLGPDSSHDEVESIVSAYGRVVSVMPWLADHGFYDDQDRTRIPMPTYPFQRKRHWLTPRWLPGGNGVPEDSNAVATNGIDEHTDGQNRADIPSSVRKILEEISSLDLSEIDLESNFFEIGLDSLLLTPLTFKIRTVFGVRVSFKELITDLNSPSLLISKIESSLPEETDQRRADSDIEETVEPEAAVSAPLLPAQRLYLPDQGVGQYSATILFKGQLNLEKLESSLLSLISENDALRAQVNPEKTSQSFDPTAALDLRIRKGLKEIDKQQIGSGRQDGEISVPRLRVDYEEDREGHASLRLQVPSCFCDLWSMDLLIEKLAQKYRTAISAPGSTETQSYASLVKHPSLCDQGPVSDLFWKSLIARHAVDKPSPSKKPAQVGPAHGRIVIDGVAFKDMKMSALKNGQSLFSVFIHHISKSFDQYRRNPNRLFAITLAGQPYLNKPDLVGQLAQIVPLETATQDMSSKSIHARLAELYDMQIGSFQFWEEYSPSSFAENLIRLTHIKRLSEDQTDFGVTADDYWFDLTPDSQFENHITFTEYENSVVVDFCSFDGSYNGEAVNRILSIMEIKINTEIISSEKRQMQYA